MARKTRPESFGNIPDSEYDILYTDHMCYGMKLDEHQYGYMMSILNTDKKITFCEAPAGSGKTTLAFAGALRLFNSGNYNGIIYMMAPYGENRQGYLPGDITEKSEVYFEPAYQAMIKCNLVPYQVVSNEPLCGDKQDGFITLITNTFIRGTNFENKVVIIDEAQNFTEHELRTAISRIHDTCKVIIIGHTLQCDISSNKSGFEKCMNHFKCKHSDISDSVELVNNYRGEISKAADEPWEEWYTICESFPVQHVDPFSISTVQCSNAINKFNSKENLVL